MGIFAACDYFEYQCGSGECILAKMLLNGNKDCVDGSDEGAICISTGLICIYANYFFQFMQFA